MDVLERAVAGMDASRARLEPPLSRPPAARPEPAFSEPVELLIDLVGAQGDGVASGRIYTPLTLAGERVMARVAGDRAEVESILTPSPERVEPPCPHFGACGGCSLQHWSHAPYLAWKVEQIRLTLAREGIETNFVEAFAAAPGSRRRVALHARKGSRAAAVVGYKARRSWNLVPIEVCPIADPRLVAAFPALRRLAPPFFQSPKSAPMLHVTLTGTGIDVDVTGVGRRSGGLSADAGREVAARAAEAGFARVTLGGEMLYGAMQPVVQFGRGRVVLPPGGFLQASQAAETAMAAFICEAAAGANRIADLFCGAGTFTFPLADIAPVLAADSSPEAIAALKAGLPTAPGLKPVDAQARDLFRRPVLAAELKKIDVVVFDPPRAGAAEQAAQLAESKVSTVVGVSCNPATFARDAAILIAGGFRLDRVKPVDQFLWSPHIELVGVFVR